MYTFNDSALIAHLNEKFSSVDTDGSGKLDRETFHFIAHNLDLELADDQVMVLCMEADADADYKISYAKIVPRLAVLAKEMLLRKQHGDEPILITGKDKWDVDYVIRGISKVPRALRQL